MTTRPEIVGYLDERDLAELLQGEKNFPFKTPLIRLSDYEDLAAPAVQEETLADRMRAAGMLTIDEMMNKTPLDGFIRHAGVHDLDSYGQWLDMKCRDFLTMQAKRELNKDPEDDMYEWVIAHAAAFQEARINFNAARPATTEQQSAPDVTALVEALEPFAKCADELDGAPEDGIDPADDDEWAKFRLLVSDFRRARAALAAHRKGGGL